jgi:hypothetical protein
LIEQLAVSKMAINLSNQSGEVPFAQSKEEFMDHFTVEYQIQLLKEQLEKLKNEIPSKNKLSVSYLNQIRTEVYKCHMELNDVIEEHIQKCINQKREEAEASLALPIASPEQILNVQVKLDILERFNGAVAKVVRDQRKLYNEMMETAFPKLGETPSTDELTQKHNQVLANVCLLLKLDLKKIDSGIDQAECIHSLRESIEQDWQGIFKEIEKRRRGEAEKENGSC